MNKILALVASHLLALGLALGVGYLLVVNARLQHEVNEALVAKQQAFQQAATADGWKATAVASQSAMAAQVAALQASIEKLRKAGGTVASTQHTTATIHDTVPAAHDVVAGEWHDEYHRFHLNIPTGILTRDQLFTYDAAVAIGPDGSTRVLKESFEELDPTTRLVVPGPSPRLESHLSFAKDLGPAVPVFHPRVVAAIGLTGAPGGGVELLNLERLKAPVLSNLNLSALALYDAKNSDAQVGGMLGYRLRFPFFDSNISVGPSLMYSLKRGTTSVGAAVTIEVTR